MAPTNYPKAPKGSAAAATFKSLEGLGIAYAGSTAEGGRFRCANPGHDDDRPSMDVTIGRKGVPLFNCKPCEQAMGQPEFIDALRSHGVKWRGDPCTVDDIDWGEPAVVHRVTVAKDGKSGDVRLTHVYTYNHEDGEPNFKVNRYDPTEGSDARKQFRPYRWATGWKVGLDGVERTPYNLDRFGEWAGGVIYLVEGEKAADALTGVGRAATTFHGGAAGKVEGDWVERYGFARFAQVRVWPDADEAGVDRARELVAALVDAGVNAVFYGTPANTLAPKDDAYDVIERGEQRSGRVLNDSDLADYCSLHPKPTTRLRLEAPERLPDGPKVNGKVITSATGYEPGSDDPGAQEDDEEGDEPYGVSVTQEPYEFTAEFLDREFRLDGVLTLRHRHDDRTFWVWSRRRSRYDHLSEDELVAQIKARLRGKREVFMTADGPEGRPVKVHEKTAKEVLAHLRSLTLTSEYGAGALLPSQGGVPFRNGWLDAKTGELVPIGPERDVRWNVQADYDPTAECPEWLRFLASLGWTKDSEEYRLLRQWMGYLLSGSKEQERALLMLGPSRAGKGTIIRVCMALLGDGATGTSLESMMSNFGLQPFIGKGLATIGDARFGRSDKGLNARLLSLTSNDELPVDVKYGKPLSINLPIRLMIATNETPNFIEASDALARRFVALVFEKTFAENPDHGLFGRLVKELPGIARWALGGLRDLEQEGKFTETTRGKALQKQMIEESAFVRLFVDECCVLGSGFRVDNKSLYAEYAVWAEQNKMPVFNSVRFSRELCDAFPGQIENGSFKVGRKVVRGKIGVKTR